MSFAMMGDIVCASRQAYFLQAFARIGLIPDGGATFLLPRLVGWGEPWSFHCWPSAYRRIKLKSGDWLIDFMMIRTR